MNPPIEFDGPIEVEELPTLSPEDFPDVENLVIEDGAAVDSIFSEKQYRLLTEPLYSSWPGPGEGRNFVALANVGLFFMDKQPLLAPDVMLSLDVESGAGYTAKENNTYCVWARGKVPDVVIEIVSDRRGDEEGRKMRLYARWGIWNYVLFDPAERLRHGVLRAFLLGVGGYEPAEPSSFRRVGLGLTLWEGVYEDRPDRWLRWCDPQGRLIPTGYERAEQERQRAEQERQRRERLEAQLRAAGIEPAP